MSEEPIFIKGALIRRPNTTTSNNKIVVIAHTLDSLDYFGFVIGNYFDSFEILWIR
jgi:hypothetical protein